MTSNTATTANLIDMKDFSIEISLVHHSRHVTSVWLNFKLNALGAKFPACNDIVQWFDPCDWSRFSGIFLPH